MSKFDPLSFDCPVCIAKKGQFCDKDFLEGLPFVQTVGYYHEQRGLYNLLADQPADGAVPSKEAFADAVRKSGLI
jgi:hypothetical protein